MLRSVSVQPPTYRVGRMLGPRELSSSTGDRLGFEALG